jgi:hypothetical protein
MIRCQPKMRPRLASIPRNGTVRPAQRRASENQEAAKIVNATKIDRMRNIETLRLLPAVFVDVATLQVTSKGHPHAQKSIFAPSGLSQRRPRFEAIEDEF